MYTRLLLVTTLLCFGTICLSQKNCDRPDPLENYLFNKMVVRDITFAIVGEATPTSGVKVDVSKPEAIISLLNVPPDKIWKIPSGLIPDLVTFDFKGGIVAQNFNIFRGGGNFGTAFEAKPSLHYIPAASRLKFGTCDVAKPAALLIKAKNQLVQDGVSALRDSLAALEAIRQYYLDTVALTKAERQKSVSLSSPQKLLVRYFISKFLKVDALRALPPDTVSLFCPLKKAEYVNPQNGVPLIKNDSYLSEIDDTYKKYVKSEETIDKDIQQIMI